MVPGPAWKLVEMQIWGPHSRPTELETVRVGSEFQQSLQGILMHSGFKTTAPERGLPTLADVASLDG